MHDGHPKDPPRLKRGSRTPSADRDPLAGQVGDAAQLGVAAHDDLQVVVVQARQGHDLHRVCERRLAILRQKRGVRQRERNPSPAIVESLQIVDGAFGRHRCRPHRLEIVI
jgi:hypothetical protein